MTWHAVYREADGGLVSIGTRVADPLPDGLATVEYAERPNGRWDAKALDFVVHEPEVALSRLDFLRLFTRDERIAIRTSGDPVIEDLREMLLTAEVIRLAHPDTVGAVDYMVAQGMLTRTRGDQILAGEAPGG